ncbi:MAG TPA: nicotinamide riboside transporter PnuC [Polyangiaceae bacterium]|nr:nicotinamide riboside transporter PnuC [Polyangiaceae bacterium]
MSVLELVAVICGFLCVLLTIRENIWCWPAGLVQVTLYVFIFFEAKLYSDVLLHIIYISMNLYGWYFWLHGGRERQKAKVTGLGLPLFVASAALSAAGTLALGYMMESRTDASYPYADAFTTAFSLMAQWLMSRKKYESWDFWISVDVVAIYIYGAKGLYATALLYVAFLVMAVLGRRKWYHSMRQSEEIRRVESRPEWEPAS